MNGKVAILPWADVIEDYLDPLGTSVEGFATAMSGGWLFGYAEALSRVGIGACVICFSRERTTRRFVHPQTGVVTVALPVSPAYCRFRAHPLFKFRPIGQFLDRLATPVGDLTRVLREENVTIVLCQEYEYHRAAAALAAGRATGAKVFATFQGGFPSDFWLERTGRARAIREMDGLIIASQAELRRVLDTYRISPAKVAMVPNPLDIDRWQPTDRATARRELGLPEEAGIVICHGRIDIYRKGVDILLQAWRALVSENAERDWRLHLVGTGSGEEELRRIVAADPVPGLRWTAYTADRAVMRRELSAADLYVSASRNEGFAVAPLEAMACGLPVILSTAPGSAEMLPNGNASGGIITPIGDVKALRSALGGLLSDPQIRERMGRAARVRVTSFAGLDQVGAQLRSALGL